MDDDPALRDTYQYLVVLGHSADPALCPTTMKYWYVSWIYVLFCMKETWQHASVHWQQGKYQLWANELKYKYSPLYEFAQHARRPTLQHVSLYISDTSIHFSM